MKRPDDPGRKEEGQGDRLSRLSQASLRINESLDLDTVLQGVVDGARSLTGARHGGITVLDDGGKSPVYITSGLTLEERRLRFDLPGGRELFEHLSGLREPLRVADFSGYAREMGLPEIVPPLGPVGAFLGAPIRHLGDRVGNVYLSGKERDAEFTPEDEAMLTIFASQAALAIANARRHREERRARADLETLIDTSPVGVVVFDAVTGVPRSLNREVRRIVDSLCNPDQTTEMLLDVVTCLRADGQEVSLTGLPLSGLLSAGETIRAEEIVVRVPDGRSVTVLLNATPIRSEEGEVESVVVTLQDMTPLEELERLRAEFLATVSHELRAPLTSIKGSAATVLGSAEEVDPALVRQFFRIVDDQADHMHGLVADLLDVARIETGTLPVDPEPAEVAVLVDRARNTFSSAEWKNSLSIDIAPGLPLVLADRRRIVQVLVNLLSNAARHSSDSSTIQVTAAREGVHVVVSVADDGRGIPAESLPNLFRKFSVAQSEEQGGDTGLGLAVCKGIVEAHGGRIWAESDGPGLGARFTFTLPTVDGAGSDMAGGISPFSTRSSRRSVRTADDPVRILAVDDDPEALRYVRDVLARSGYTPIVTGDPEEALSLMADRKPGLVLLDLMLPGTDGIQLMKDMLTMADVPVIFLSVYGQEELIVKAFDMGAEDYVVKPFSPSELAARIRAALRKREVSEPSEPYVHRDLTIDYAERRVTLGGRLVPLVAIEYRMLAELSANAGRVVTQEQLLQRVWGEKSSGDMRPMRTIASRLRRKLGDDANNPTYIFTEPRVGYRMPKGETLDPAET